MRVEASAPSNIALIKYMGKTQAESNLPTNASLSYSVENLRSFVTLEEGGNSDTWEPLPGFPALALSDVGLRKFLTHFARLKANWGIRSTYVIRSANNFPSDCGIASSASSFAALTRATALLASKLSPALKISDDELSRLSRQGSGSSCRSLFSPWAVWRGEGAEKLDLSLRLEHAVILVDEGKKEVTTSDAHKRVISSALFSGRTKRAEDRLAALIESLRNDDWRQSFELCWSEFWDMHALFETSQPAFGYMRPGTLTVLHRLRQIWRETGDGPLVTMDAGANVHVFLRADQVKSADSWLRDLKTIKSWTHEKV